MSLFFFFFARMSTAMTALSEIFLQNDHSYGSFEQDLFCQNEHSYYSFERDFFVRMSTAITVLSEIFLPE